MVAKAGRPFSENPKDTMIRVRMDKATVDKLDQCVQRQQSNRSEIIRLGIEKMYDAKEK